MWEIEALMENSIRLIDQSNVTLSEKRNLIWNVYNLQGQFDCSFTHFRLMDMLLKNEYVQPYEIAHFPISSKYPNYFNELSNKDFEWIRKNPVQKWSQENSSIAYWDKKSEKIYVDFGTEYYTKHLNEKSIEFQPLELGLKIIEASNIQNIKSNIYDWTAFMIIYLLEEFSSEKKIETLKENYFSRIKVIFQRFNFKDYEPINDGLDLNNSIEQDWLSDTQKKLIEFIITK